MALFSEYVEREQVGAQIVHTQHMRKIGVYESGILLPMVQDFADGDENFPNIVNRVPLRVRTANDGMRRFLPIPGNDAVYMEMGAPFVQVGGDWTQVSLGTPSRSGHTLTWTRPQTITTVQHGGHFLDLRIELLGGFVPENSRIAFPVGLQGLTRSGLNIQRGGVTVARLRPFQMIDAANPLAAPRPITHNFTTRNGQPFLVLTLPSLAGMSRPVIDPTLDLQPDASAGKDSMISPGSIAAWNFGAADTLQWGEADSDGNNVFHLRPLIQFDLSSIAASATVSAATLSLYASADLASSTSTAAWYRLKRAWVEGTRTGANDSTPTGVTWNRYDTTNNWQTAGGDGANDREATDIGSRAMSATETLNQFKDWTLTAASVQEWIAGTFTNNGLIGILDSSQDRRYDYASSDNSTAANRPKLSVTYTEAATSRAKYFMHYARLRQ